MSTDTSTMTDLDVQRRIGELTGWRNIEMDSYWHETYDDVEEVHCLFGISPAHGERRPLPDWIGNEGVALVSVMEVAHKQQWRLLIERGESSGAFYANGVTPLCERIPELTVSSDRLARALAELLLAALEAQQ